MAALQDIARRYALQNAVQHGQADIKSCMGRIMGGHPELRGDPKAVSDAVIEAVAAVNAMDADAQRAELEAAAPEMLQQPQKQRITGLKPLPDADGGVVLRFAPNPNGPLSLGHARGVAIIAEYARMHDGDVVLRFDDTDPKVKPPLYDPAAGLDAYQWIREDFAWLAGRAPDREVRASDRIEVYHEHARQLIEAGGAYVCTCDAEAWRDMKNGGHPCPHRGIAAEDMLEAWTDMVAGGFEPGAAVLRVKTDIQHKDPALRDWTAFRIVEAIHPREAAGEIAHHVCWPLLDFESAVEDHLQGVTHVIRGKDLMDSTRKQTFLYQHLGWTYPHTRYWGRVKVHGTGRFSTSLMRAGIEEGRFSDWDDPRLPTLRALRRRGFDADAVRGFWVDLGISEKDIAVSMANLEAENQKAIDDQARRFFFVPDPVEMRVSGWEAPVAEPLVHPSHEDWGRRRLEPKDVVLLPGDEKHGAMRLKDLGNIVVMGGSAMWSGDKMDRSMPIVQWLPKESAAAMTVLRPDGDELQEVTGMVEPAALEHVGEVVQFERFGFVRLESKNTALWCHG